MSRVRILEKYLSLVVNLFFFTKFPIEIISTPKRLKLTNSFKKSARLVYPNLINRSVSRIEGQRKKAKKLAKFPFLNIHSNFSICLRKLCGKFPCITDAKQTIKLSVELKQFLVKWQKQKIYKRILCKGGEN